MGFSASNMIGGTTKIEKQTDPNELNTQELEFLLSMLKTSTLKGDQVEMFYNLVIKLQNQYILLTKK